MRTRLLSFLFLFISFNVLHAQQRIIGGSAVDISQRPYQAAIFINGEFKGGGVILNNQWILTAAHVVENYPASYISVSTGYTDLSRDPSRKTASQVIKHPNYGSGVNDIALIKLSSSLVFSTTRKPVTLSNSTSYTYGTTATVSGWGSRGVNGSLSLNQLYKTNATIISCSGNDLAAAVSKTLPYHGDSGGPLTISSTAGDLLIGIVRASADGNNPTTRTFYYTNVGTYYDWIVSNTSYLHTISGDDLLCGNGTFTITPIPFNHKLELSNNVSLVSQSGGSISLQGKGQGRGFINILVNNKIIGQKFLWVGAPIISGISYNPPYLKAETFGISAGITNTQWTIGSNNFTNSSASIYSPYSSGTYTISVRATNRCGTSNTYTTQIDLSRSGTYSIILNTGSRSVTVLPTPDNSWGTVSTLSTSTSTMKYALVNLSTGSIAVSGVLPTSGGTLDFANAASGLYVLKLFTSNGKEEAFKVALN